MRTIVLFLFIASLAELISYLAYMNERYLVKTATSHIYSVVEAIILSTYFTYVNRPYRSSRYHIVAIIAWSVAGILNVAFLQPLEGLNSNIILLESFYFVTMSLYSIYIILKNASITELRYHPYFRIAIICLVTWSCTLFFWATIKILYRNHWTYIQSVMDAQAIISTLSYLAIGVTLFFYPKNKAFENI
ncbi:MAG: hypothetical protein KF744_09905 [Taibaiella sp.]|nr:hypothetical protein [Taibaiella sp.]